VVKRFYLDLETTGANSSYHSIIQLAFIIEVEGKVTNSFVGKCCPPEHELLRMDKKAQAAHKKTPEEIRTYGSPKDLFIQMCTIINENNKAYPGHFEIWGQNAKFDREFLLEFFIKHGVEWNQFKRIFDVYVVDLLGVTSLLLKRGLLPDTNLKLDTLCELFNIQRAQTHDALEDIKATKEIFDIIVPAFLREKSEVDLKYINPQSPLYAHLTSSK
jgi:DNA polymerase III epsilon subunit-like protein